jgi:hypothetical protein
MSYIVWITGVVLALAWVSRVIDAGILFAWNYEAEIVPKLRDRGFTGEILIP